VSPYSLLFPVEDERARLVAWLSLLAARWL
jgi:hypothetical protein